MKKLVACISLMALIFLIAAPASPNVGITVNWGAFTYFLMNENEEPLKDLCLVQLIWDADADGIDEPGEDGLPSGGDELLDISFIGSGSFFPGKFSMNTTLTHVGVGERIYMRVWNAQEIGKATYYGDTRAVQPGLWTIDNPVGLTMDVTKDKSWGTTISWEPTGVALGRLVRTYRTGLPQNQPNPFHGSTTVGYSVRGTRTWEMLEGGGRTAVDDENETREVRISIYDVSGRQVRQLIDTNRMPGFYQIVWDAKDDLGRKVPSGSYFCRLSVGSPDGSTRTITKKMVLLK